MAGRGIKGTLAWTAVAAAVVTLPLWVLAGPVTVPAMDREGKTGELNAFVKGMPAKAAEVNHNFALLAEELNTLRTEILSLRADVTALKAKPPGHGARSVQVFTQSGTWRRPDGIHRVWVRLVGGGGGGGGGMAASGIPQVGGGGGGGGYAEEWIDVSGLTELNVVVSAGGLGTTAAPGWGAPGGETSFGSYVRADGGGGGQAVDRTNAVAASGGAGGGASGGDLNYAGLAGEGSVPATGTKNGVAGRGGIPVFSWPENGRGGDGGEGVAGRPGTPGIVIVWEYE